MCLCYGVTHTSSFTRGSLTARAYSDNNVDWERVISTTPVSPLPADVKKCHTTDVRMCSQFNMADEDEDEVLQEVGSLC